MEEITSFFRDPTDAELRDPNIIRSLKMVLFCVSIGKFILTPLLFMHLVNRPSLFHFGWDRPARPLLIAMVLLIMLCVGPLTNWVYELNKSIRLPQFMEATENTLMEMEESAARLTKALLMTSGIVDLLLNILLIGIVAAVGEELFFRGVLLNVLHGWTKNLHAAVWISAFVFSFIHYQFYGFLPRFLLGALLGYLFIWNGSLWMPIIAHFVNNVVLVIFYFSLERGWTDMAEPDIQPLFVLLSLIPLSGLLYYYYLLNRKIYRDGKSLDPDLQHNRELQGSPGDESAGESRY
jgi:membrane protease YdiL (CAAX protease family)